MGDVDVSIFSISGAERGMHPGRRTQQCPPAVVITHDSDNFSPSSINPSSEEGLLSYKSAGGLGASTLSLATEGRNGLFTGAPPSRTGSPRHSKIHPSEGSSLPKSGSSMAVFSTESQMLGNEAQLEHLDQNQKNHCCSGRARRTALGLFLTVIMCGTWVGITHLLKWAYIIHLMPPYNCNCTTINDSSSPNVVVDIADNRSISEAEMLDNKNGTLAPFKAPFITTWIFTACNCLFFPVYLCTRFCSRRTRTTARRSILEAMRRFREKGLSALHFLTRSVFFCVLWVGANYMLIHSIGKLDATAVMALQASSASFVYLLSWVILHEQFVGIRIVAVIMCNTGIALLAYMDGVSRTSTLGGVVLAAAAAAGLAVHKYRVPRFLRGATQLMDSLDQNCPGDTAWAQIHHPWFKAGIFLLLCVLPVWGSLLFGVMGIIPLAAYVLVSVVTYFLYRNDKRSARSDSWRTPESKLHAAEMFGGWPGALLAQQAFRHKTSKRSYQLSFWTIVLLHQVFWMVMVWPQVVLIYQMFLDDSSPSTDENTPQQVTSTAVLPAGRTPA